MAMREETKRRLDRMLLRSRLLKVGIGVVIVAAVITGFVLSGIDAHVDNRRVKAVVERIEPFAGKATGRAVMTDVRLASGGQASVLVPRTSLPLVGETIEIIEHHHGTGRITYSWK